MSRILASLSLTRLTVSVDDSRPPDPVISMHSAQRKPFNDWQPVWNSAARTISWGMGLLVGEVNSIQKLDVFHSSTACSLAIDQIGPALESLNVQPLHRLRHLSLSLSGSIDIRDRDMVSRSEDAAKYHVDQAARFINVTCPALRSLDLHWYSLRVHNLTPAERIERNVFGQIAGFHRSASLQHVSLRGIYITQAALLAFVENNKMLSSITMEDIHLNEESKFKPFFDYLTVSRRLDKLRDLHFDNLFEDSRLICFQASGKPHAPTTNKRDGPNEIHLMGAALRRPIRYALQRGSMRGSIAATNWVKVRKMKFGPPASMSA